MAKERKESAEKPTDEEEKLHFDEISLKAPNVLDPDDALMSSFQKTLRSHLSRVDSRLSEEILELEASVKRASDELESQGVLVYSARKEVERQRDTIQRYEEALMKIVWLREEKARQVNDVKARHTETRSKLSKEQKKKGKLGRELEKLFELQRRFSEWEKELNDYLLISRQISTRDSNARKESIVKKQRNDFILFRLEEEIWKAETEIFYLDEQLQIKDGERAEMRRTIVDANTDLEALYKEHKNLRDAWNSVVGNICKRDKVYEQLYNDRKESQHSYEEVLVELEKLRKDTDKQIEFNEYLTSLYSRVDNEAKSVPKTIDAENQKAVNLESELMKISKLGEQTKRNYDDTYARYRDIEYKVERATKELEGYVNKKNELERSVFVKLEDKVVKDKAARYINVLLLDSKESMLEYELLIARTENSYGNDLLNLERSNDELSCRKTELQEISQRNTEKEKETDELRKQITKYGTTIERKQRRLHNLNKSIEELVPRLGGEEIGPHDLKIMELEKMIKEIRENAERAQQFWMRRQGFMVSLSQQRNSQLQDLNLLNKEIVIMEQKNLKLEYAFETLGKEEANANRTLSLLEQRLSRMNAVLVARKELREELQDKNCLVRNESVVSFQNLEFQLIVLRTDLKHLYEETCLLKDELRAAQEESLSWEKKVRLTQESVKKIKEERTAGGIASMKNEIHKMEMRLSHLKRVQEKLIHDMEFYVSRREILVDKAVGRIGRNPKEKHNRKVVFHKRLLDQRTKIKQLLKARKETESRIQELQNQTKVVRDELEERRSTLKSLEEAVPGLDEEIEQFETIKCHNLQELVFKQRKAKLLRDVKNGKYKTLARTETSIEEEMKNELIYRQHLKYAMERTSEDFPFISKEVRKVLLALRPTSLDTTVRNSVKSRPSPL